jgi:hypothetical protein
MVGFGLTDDFLRSRGRFASGAPVAGLLGWLVAFIVVFGGVYGAVMASFTGLAPGRFTQLLYVAAKVPMLLLVSFALCLPSFFVINTLAGLRADFAEALRAVVATQAGVAIVLASLAPVTILSYLSMTDYQMAKGFNGLIFAAASLGGQGLLRRYYQPLIRRSPRHRTMLYFWFVLYVFVAIQMAWVLRPFIGNPDLPVSFFREEAWGNAYVDVLQTILRSLDP